MGTAGSAVKLGQALSTVVRLQWWAFTRQAWAYGNLWCGILAVLMHDAGKTNRPANGGPIRAALPLLQRHATHVCTHMPDVHCVNTAAYMPVAWAKLQKQNVPAASVDTMLTC